jgi:hypothetical protein
MESPFIQTDSQLGVVLNPGVLTRVQRAAARDHAGRDVIALMQEELLLAREPDEFLTGAGISPALIYRMERIERSNHNMPRCRGGWPMVRVDAVNVFDTPYGDGSVAEVTVTYDHDGGFAGAIYGVYADGHIALWAN